MRNEEYALQHSADTLKHSLRNRVWNSYWIKEEVEQGKQTSSLATTGFDRRDERSLLWTNMKTLLDDLTKDLINTVLNEFQIEQHRDVFIGKDTTTCEKSAGVK